MSEFIDMENGYKYCPHCGAKIAEVRADGDS